MKTRYAITAAALLALSFASSGSAQTSTNNNADLAARVQKLEDVEAIRQLLIEYGRALDKRDFPAYGRLFAKDGSWKGGMGGATGPDKIAEMVRQGFAKMSPELYEKSNHVMTSMDIELNGDTAKAWSRWLWIVKGSDGRPRVERGGYYEDSLVRENGQWKFKTRQAFTELG